MTPRSSWGRVRASVRGRPIADLIYRIVVAVVGVAVTVVGLILVPVPFPISGWLLVILGLFILSTEFAWAERALRRVRGQIERWTRWVQRQGWPVRALLAAGSVVLTVGLIAGSVRVFGYPAWLPWRI